MSCCLARISSEGDTETEERDNPLHAAMKHNYHREVSHLLLAKDIDITTVTIDSQMTSKLMNTKNRCGYTALMLAVGKGHLDCVKELTKLEGIDWETKKHRGESLEDVAR